MCVSARTVAGGSSRPPATDSRCRAVARYKAGRSRGGAIDGRQVRGHCGGVATCDRPGQCSFGTKSECVLHAGARQRADRAQGKLCFDPCLVHQHDRRIDGGNQRVARHYGAGVIRSEAVGRKPQDRAV